VASRPRLIQAPPRNKSRSYFFNNLRDNGN
jgi:hypothetical protein